MARRVGPRARGEDRPGDRARPRRRAPLVVVHPPYRWQTAYRSWVDERLSAAAAERRADRRREHVPVARPRPEHRSVPRSSIARELEGFPDVTLDTSHLAVAGLDPVETLSRLGDRLAHVHLSNNAGKGWDSHLPLDQLDLGRFLEALATRGFEGAISLEIDLRESPRRRAGVAPHPFQPRALRERALRPRPIRPSAERPPPRRPALTRLLASADAPLHAHHDHRPVRADPRNGDLPARAREPRPASVPGPVEGTPLPSIVRSP